MPPKVLDQPAIPDVWQRYEMQNGASEQSGASSVSGNDGNPESGFVRGWSGEQPTLSQLFGWRPRGDVAEGSSAEADAETKQEPSAFTHLTGQGAKASIGRENRLASGGLEIYALDSTKVPASTLQRKIATFGVKDVSAEIPIPNDFNDYFKPVPAIGPIGLMRQHYGVHVAPPGVFDFETKQFLQNVKRMPDGTLQEMTPWDKWKARQHQRLMDYGHDGVLYGSAGILAAAKPTADYVYSRMYPTQNDENSNK